MAEALVSLLLETLKTKGQEWLMTKAEEWLSARENLLSLSDAFTTIQAVLYDAERMKGKDKALSIWFERLKDVAYDLGDLLDECNVEELKAQIEGSSRYAASSSNIFGPANRLVKLGADIEFGRRMDCRINDIKKKLHELCNERNNFHLKEHVHRDSKMDTRRTSSMIDESGVFGRKPDKDRVVNLLLGDMNQVCPVISIFGMDGLGKTTLAQLVYNDLRVIRHFEKRMWVHVSSNFDVERICNAISESATGDVVPNYANWDTVQNYLKHVLQGKRFLLVLDDVWNKDREEWEKLRLPLQGGAPDSRIIITTCDQRVEKAMRVSRVHFLPPLLEEECQSLFNHLAFSGWRENERSDFEDIGREIVMKCKGVPLIVKRWAYALCFMRTTEEWRSVLNSETWDHVSSVQSWIELDILAFYHNMPSSLKQCFAFCSIFPKDHILEKDTLIQLWMAQGFILPKEYEKMEIIGERYFQDLLSLSMLEDLTTDQKGRMKHCKMKDIVHDMLHTIIGEYHIINKETQIKKDIPVNARNVTLICSEDIDSIPSSLCELEKLRTLMIIGWSRIVEVSNDLFYKWKCLRSLDMSGSKVRRLPDSLRNLKLLQFLNLSTTEIDELPESTCDLLLLQTLKLNECRRLRKLPKEMRKLVCLRHLKIKGTSSLEYLPKGIGKLTSLVTLSKFIIANDENGSSIEELEGLDHLEGELDVVNLDCIPNEDSAWKARLMDKKCIDRLGLYYTARNDNEWPQIGDDEMKRVSRILSSLPPHCDLKELTICNYSGNTLPLWIDGFLKLTYLRLAECRLCDNFSPFEGGNFSPFEGGNLSPFEGANLLPFEGFNLSPFEGFNLSPFAGSRWPHLKHLELDGMHRISDITMNYYPKLETLIFRRMHGWKEWFLGNCNPNLIQLTISECPNLSSLPSQLGQCQKLQSLCIEGCTKLMRLPSELRHLTNLQHLRIAGCPQLKERCREGGDDWISIAHARNITIDEEQVK